MRKILITMHDSAYAEIHQFVQQANRAQKEIEFSQLRLPESARKVLFTNPLDAEAGSKEAHSIRAAHELASGDSLIVVVEGNIQDEKDDEYFIVNGADHSAAGESYSGVALLSLYYLNPNSAFRKKAESWWSNLAEVERRRIASDSILLLILSAVASEFTKLEFHDETRSCIMDFCQTPTDIVAALKGGFQFCEEVCSPLLRQDVVGQSLLAIAEGLSKNPFRFQQLPTGEFDVIFFYDEKSKTAVREIGDRLKERGLEPWLVIEQRRPGFTWQRALEQQIDKIRAAAVFVGEDGIGPWQDSEIEAFIRRFVKREAPVIPVILDGTKAEPTLPALLDGRTWVDFRHEDPDPINQLIWGITALAPSSVPFLSTRIPATEQGRGAGQSAPQTGEPFRHSEVVISLHGIRTRGAWQKDLDTELAQAKFIPRALDYGFFRAFKLLIPSSRRKQVDWFREQYTRVTENLVQKPSIVAHSLGTYLVASAMDIYDEIEFDQVIFCGSIVSRDFGWSRFVSAGRIRRLLNDCGKRDRWVKLAAWVINDAGPSGAYGFSDTAGGQILERHHPQFRHSDYFYSLNFRQNWVPFLKGGEPGESMLSQKRPTNWKFVIVKITLLTILVGALAWLLYKFLAARFF